MALLRILIHPPQNMIKPRNVPVRANDAGESMRLFGVSFIGKFFIR